jgi:aspartyl-tRNA synthetase
MVFFELRQEMDTIQALLVQSANEVSKQMYKFAASISPESIILVKGTIKKSPIEINATTVKDVELHIAQVS